MSNLLKDASILLTPTAYENGRMNAIKPYKDLYGSELVTNGDFSQGSTGWTIQSGTVNITDKAEFVGSSILRTSSSILTSGKKYKITYEITSITGSPVLKLYDGAWFTAPSTVGTHTVYRTINSVTFYLRNDSSNDISIDNISVVEDLSGDFTFSRNSAATRVNAQGLVENVQIISSELVSNGDFSQIGTEEVLNGDFSQEGSELVTNGGFDTDSDWSKGSNWTISGGSANCDGVTATSNLSQVITSFSGKTFLVEGNASNVSQGFAYISLGGTDLQIVVNSSGSFKHYVTISSGNSTLFISARNNFIGSIDNVSVKEVGQNWTLGTGWSIGEDKAIFDGGSDNNLSSASSVTNGKSYKYSFTISDMTTGALSFRLGSAANNDLRITQDGTYSGYAIADGTSILFRAESGFNGSITNISVKEVGQDWTLGSFTSIGNNVANIVNSTGELSLQQNIGISQKTIKLTYTISNYASGGIRPQYGAVNGLNRSANGTYTEIITGANVSSNLSFFSITANTTATITNISAKEITDDTDIPRINYSGFSYQDSLGSELLTNGDFATNIDGWGGNTTRTWNNGTLVSVGVGAGNNTNIQVGSILTAGKTYRFTWEIVSTDANASFVYTSSEGQITNSYVGAGTFTEDVTIVSNSTYVDFRFTGANTTTVYNSVSVKEVTGQEVVPDSGCGSWLLEPQSTNLINNSELLNIYFTNKVDTTITDNYGTSPSGETNSSRIQFVDDTSFCYSVISVSTDHTSSVFVKGISGETVRFGIGSSVVTGDLFTFNGLWQRIDFTASSATQIFFSSYGGATTRDFEAFGLQLEALSYATSYIPTNGATNTRLQDIANNSGNSTLINSTEGVLYFEVKTDNSNVGSISINDGTISNRITARFRSDISKIQLSTAGSTDDFNFNSDAITLSDYNKIAIVYDNGDYYFFINGVKSSVQSRGTFSANTFTQLDFNRGGGGEVFYGKTKALAVYKEAKTDANLRCLTYPNPVATTFDLDFDTIAEQFTFTRGSEATFVNEQGLIESTNQIGEEEVINGDFENGSANWSLSSESEVVNSQARIYSSDGSFQYIQQSDVFDTSKQYKLEFDVISSNGAVLGFAGGIPDVSTNVLGKKTLYVSPSISTLQIKRSSGITDVTIDNVSVKEVITATNTPRIDYSTGVKAFLLEPQSTNLITYSEDFSNASYSKAGEGLGSVPIVTSNYATSPSGEQNADRIQFDLNGGTDGGDSSWIFTFPASDIDGIVSVYLKTNDDSTKVVYFRNTFGTIDNVTVNGNWQRYSITNPTTRGFYLGLRGGQGNSDSADLSVWGAQVEQKSYATSYIPTSGATATRNQELCVDATPVINSEEGTLYAEISALTNGGSTRTLSLNNGTSNVIVMIRYRSDTNQIQYLIKDGINADVGNSYTLTDATQYSKVALKYKSNDISFWVDGIEVSSSTSTISLLGLNDLSFDGSGTQNFFGNTKGLKYYPKALADVQLEDLTTI